MIRVKRIIVGLVAALAIAAVACSDDAEDATSSTKQLKAGTGKSLSSFPTSGVATFYDADGSGNCSFEATPDDLDVAAMDLPEYNGSQACGSCLEVTGPKGKVKVRVVDSCPGCEDHGVNLDLSASAFAKIAEPKKGRIDITYAAAPCDVKGNIEYHFKDGSSKYWTAIQLRNHKVAVTKLEYQKGSKWLELERADYNYFVAESGVGDQPDGLTLRVTSIDGQTLEDTLPGPIQANKTVRGKSQFE